MNKYLFFTLILLLSSCSTLKKVSKLKDKDIIISLSKSPCATKCSVYNVKLYKNGYVVYEGIANVEKYGLYAKKLSSSEMDKIKKEFDNNDFFGFDDQYPNPDPDMPTIVMVYNKDMKSKTITGGIDRPKKVLDLQRVLETLIRSDNFELLKSYDVKTSKTLTEDKENTQEEEVTYIIDNEIIIEFNPNVFMSQWLQKYSQYHIQLVKRLGQNSPYWVITFNKTIIDSNDMLELIKQDTQVKSAEFNKKVSSR